MVHPLEVVSSLVLLSCIFWEGYKYVPLLWLAP